MDISMCQSQECKVAHLCRRNAASGTKPDPYRQNYADFSPSSKDGCDAFWLSPKGKPRE